MRRTLRSRRFSSSAATHCVKAQQDKCSALSAHSMVTSWSCQRQELSILYFCTVLSQEYSVGAAGRRLTLEPEPALYTNTSALPRMAGSCSSSMSWVL
jgi:hypothetical protein